MGCISEVKIPKTRIITAATLRWLLRSHQAHVWKIRYVKPLRETLSREHYWEDKKKIEKSPATGVIQTTTSRVQGVLRLWCQDTPAFFILEWSWMLCKFGLWWIVAQEQNFVDLWNCVGTSPRVTSLMPWSCHYLNTLKAPVGQIRIVNGERISRVV